MAEINHHHAEHADLISESLAKTHTAMDCLGAAAEWANVHCARTRAELRAHMREEFNKILPGISLAVLINDGNTKQALVELVQGDDCPLSPETRIQSAAWQPENGSSFPLYYGMSELGTLRLSQKPEPSAAAVLDTLLVHYATALVNLELTQTATQYAESCSSSLQAFEQGVVLFQQQDSEAVAAGFLNLCQTAMNADGGAVFILDEMGQPDSNLHLDQTMGLPEEILQGLCLAENEEIWWPQTLMQGGPQFLQRNPETGKFDLLCDDRIPGGVRNIMGAPMHYHGIDVGACLLFNVQDSDASLQIDMGSFQSRLDSFQKLFVLGAALFHRRAMEEEALQSRQLQTQLDIASIIQSRLIPSDPPHCKNLEFSWRSVMSQQVGGDYLDCLEGVNGEYIVTIADVSGHGVDSALLMTSFRSTYRAESLRTEPDALLNNLNNVMVHEVGDTGMFLTTVTLKIAADGRSFSFASAGHNPFFLYRPSEDRFISLESSGPPLGVMKGVDFLLEDVVTEPGDVLVLYTDGVVEATAQNAGDDFEEEDMYGEERLKDLIRLYHTESSTDIKDRVFQDVRDYSGMQTQSDDISMMVIKFS